MATGFWLVDHGGSRQYRTARRGGARPSGVVVIHTAENATDTAGEDRGAESVARFIAGRADYGSYHVLCDADTTLRLAPWWYECWHDTRTNPHSVGISGAVRSADWGHLGERGDAIVVRMAHAARDYATWLEHTYGVTIPARVITRAQALERVPGFVAHGTMDPGRRTDPGVRFKWDLFLATYAGHTPTLTPPTPRPVQEDDDMTWFIAQLYRAHLGREASTAELAHWADRARTEGLTYARVREFIAGSPEARDQAIQWAYADHLGRVPSTAEVAEWAGKPDSTDAVVAAITGSQEAQEFRRLPAQVRADRSRTARANL